MKSMNRVFLIGNLGHNPELKTSKTGKPYSRLSVATTRSWMNNEDQWEEKTEWHSVFVWGPLAERCSQHLRKGALVFVEGSLSYWKVAMQEDLHKEGYKNAIHGIEVKFLNHAKAVEHVDNPSEPINHNAVAHPA